MTQTTTPKSSRQAVHLEESFSKYRFDAEAASARTDTPDLLETFRSMTNEVEAAYAASADEDLVLAEADMAAGYETLRDE